MKGDFTRFTFQPERHFTGVRLQQGRVSLDADFNEQVDIGAHRDRVTARDLIGPAGAPDDDAGFAITGGGSLTIGAGRMYVQGTQAVNETAVAYTAQPDRPGAALPGEPGRYIAYLDIWERHLTAFERPDLRELALGGPDTATRTQAIWQVRLQAAAGATCAGLAPGWKPATPARSGTLRAQGTPPPLTADTCMVPEQGGYRRLENQLYRVEIVTGGAAGAAKFVWSRDNGTVVSRLKEVRDANKTLVLTDGGRDGVVGFTGSAFVAELSEDRRVLEGEGGVLVDVATGEGELLTLSVASADAPGFVDKTIRRWDGQGTVTAGAYTKLEGGVEVEFGGGDYAVGDYWTIPARTADGSVEWPRAGGAASFRAPHGVEHRYLPLAIVERNAAGQWMVVSDCRPLFTPLAAQIRMTMAGGDGQEADGDAAGSLIALAHPIEVAVMNGRRPVAGAQVRFEVEEGGGELPAQPVTTDGHGVASCTWKLRKGQARHRVRARLLDRAGAEVDAPVFFNAAFEAGSAPGGVCTVSAHSGDDLHDAVARLVEAGGGELCLAAGKFEIGDPLIVRDVDGITITGRGPSTQIFSRSARIFDFEACTGVTVRMLRLIAGEYAGGDGDTVPAVGFTACANVHVHDCEIICPDETDGPHGCIFMRAGERGAKGKDRVLPTARLERNRLSVGAGGIGVRLAEPALATLTDNVIELSPEPEILPERYRDLAIKVLPNLLEEAIRIETAERPAEVEEEAPRGPAFNLITAAVPRLMHTFRRSVPTDLRSSDSPSAIEHFRNAIAEEAGGMYGLEREGDPPFRAALDIFDDIERVTGEREVDDDVVLADEATDRAAREKLVSELARFLRVMDYGVLVTGRIGIVEIAGTTVVDARRAVGVLADDADGRTTGQSVVIDRSVLSCKSAWQLKGATPAAIEVRHCASVTIANTRSELRGGWAADPKLAREHQHVAAIVITGAPGSLAVVQRSTLTDWPTGVRVEVDKEPPPGVRYVSETAAKRAFKAVDAPTGVEIDRAVEIPG